MKGTEKFCSKGVIRRFNFGQGVLVVRAVQNGGGGRSNLVALGW
jgi:hypothetical protein